MQDRRLNVLMSYWYFKALDLDEILGPIEPRPNLFVDSGGFSAMSTGAEVDIVEYKRWLYRWRHWITVYANLDVIGDPEATWRNQEYMRETGFDPLPVFHYNSPWSYLERYVEQYDYVALGGLVPVRWQNMMPFLIKAFRMAKPTTRYHGFGVLAWEPLLSFPFHSVDGSYWVTGVRFGKIVLFDERRGQWYPVYSGEYRKAHVHAAFLRSYGIDPHDAAKVRRKDRHEMLVASARAWMRAETWLRRRHNSELKVYLVATGAPVMKPLIEADAAERCLTPV